MTGEDRENPPPTLHQVMTYLVNSVARARFMSDIETVRLSRLYKSHDLLRGMSIPRMRIGKVDLELPLLVEDVAASGRPHLRSVQETMLPRLLEALRRSVDEALELLEEQAPTGPSATESDGAGETMTGDEGEQVTESAVDRGKPLENRRVLQQQLRAMREPAWLQAFAKRLETLLHSKSEDTAELTRDLSKTHGEAMEGDPLEVFAHAETVSVMFGRAVEDLLTREIRTLIDRSLDALVKGQDRRGRIAEEMNSKVVTDLIRGMRQVAEDAAVAIPPQTGMRVKLNTEQVKAAGGRNVNMRLRMTVSEEGFEWSASKGDDGQDWTLVRE